MFHRLLYALNLKKGVGMGNMKLDFPGLTRFLKL